MQRSGEAVVSIQTRFFDRWAFLPTWRKPASNPFPKQSWLSQWSKRQQPIFDLFPVSFQCYARLPLKAKNCRKCHSNDLRKKHKIGEGCKVWSRSLSFHCKSFKEKRFKTMPVFYLKALLKDDPHHILESVQRSQTWDPNRKFKTPLHIVQYEKQRGSPKTRLIALLKSKQQRTWVTYV